MAEGDVTTSSLDDAISGVAEESAKKKIEDLEKYRDAIRRALSKKREENDKSTQEALTKMEAKLRADLQAK